MQDNNEKIELSYASLWKSIIRPPRDDYSEEQMGESVFIYRGKTYIRKDYNIVDKQGYILKASFIEPDEESRVSY
jgi:hypothetical protein